MITHRLTRYCCLPALMLMTCNSAFSAGEVEDGFTSLLNNKMVLENAKLSGGPQRGPIGLQHHGGRRGDGTLSPASSLMQFRNIWIKKI